MVAAILVVLALGIATRAWLAGRRGDSARVPWLLAQLGIATVIAGLFATLAGRAPDPFVVPVLLVAGLAALVTFHALTSLAFWGPFRARAIVARAPFAVTAIIMVLAGSPARALVIVAAGALLSYRWRAALGTVSLFRTALGGAALLALLLSPIPGRDVIPPEGPLGSLVVFMRLTEGLVRIYVLIGVFKTFFAFVRDPSLGIRTVTRRLALSHTLVVAVPLAITITLWVATTFFGVNAERALAGHRLIDQEATRLGASLRSAMLGGDARAALRRLVDERGQRWPGARLWLDRGAGLERVVGDSIAGERRLLLWFAALDTLPDHGVVGLEGLHWLGAAVTGGSDIAGAAMLFPIDGVLDSTLAPVLQARFRIRGSSIRPLGPTRPARASREDSIAARARSARAPRPDSVRADARAARPRGPWVNVSPERRGGPMVFAVDGESDTLKTAEDIAFAGIASVPGPEFHRGRWQRSSFMLIARADLRSTLIGLFVNVRENPPQVVPIVMIALIALALLPVAVMGFAMVGGMGRSIARAIGALRDGAAALGGGDLRHRIEIQGEDDLWETARQFNRMAVGLERAQSLEKERARLETELELARRIQTRLLPGEPPSVTGLEIAGRYEPAREVGGDYYDHVDLGGGRVLLVIADVSGKGVPAALLMSGFRASLMSQDAHLLGPDRMAERVNEFLHRSVESGKFVTAFLGFLDAASGRLVYANAGHNPPALLRADGRVEWLAAGGLMLGIMPHSRFESGEATLDHGDLLALYTDGVTEGANAAGELWGDDRLVTALIRLRGRSCADAADALVREVRDFEGEAGAADDITVLLARRT